MSILWKLNKFNIVKGQVDYEYFKYLNCVASYSRRSASKKYDSPYKIVKAKVREDELKHLGNEGGPNWELFAPLGNRFYLPGSMGLAWQGASTIIQTEAPIENLIDFKSKSFDKLHISTKKCPTLIRKNLHELFPAPEVISSEGLTLITLQYQKKRDFELGASKFVLAAREICTRLRVNGYWADFMNPFSGKPFYSYASGKNLYKVDERFRGLYMKLKRHNDCVIISTDDECAFSGNVFTNAPSDMLILKTIIDVD